MGFATALAAIGAGTKLGSALRGDKTPRLKEQYEAQRRGEIRMQRTRYEAMVRGAQKAGFNPSSVLAASGGTSPIQQAQVGNPLNQWNQVGDAFMQLGDILDPIRQETARLNNELTRQQIESYRIRNASPYGVPGMQRAPSSPSQEGPETPFGETGLGDTLTLEKLKEAALAALGADQGMWHAYMTAPSSWPTAGMMEETFGDGSIITRLHEKATPWVIGYHNWDDITGGVKNYLTDLRVDSTANRERYRAGKTQAMQAKREATRTKEYNEFMRKHYPTVYDNPLH